MGERLASAGVDVEVEVEVWPEMVHVWHSSRAAYPRPTRRPVQRKQMPGYPSAAHSVISRRYLGVPPL